MLSSVPVNIERLEGNELDREILRAAIIAEYDAINLYNQMAALTANEDLKKVLLDIAKEEKTHVGEFQALLLRTDPEHARELEHGKEEVEELIG
ncbi:MAG: ferritin family protein [Syntrophorhabdaceae bacterium]|nr:ferritin family protein [Syntrophorhabdaceae bacterium]